MANTGFSLYFKCIYKTSFSIHNAQFYINKLKINFNTIFIQLHLICLYIIKRNLKMNYNMHVSKQFWSENLCCINILKWHFHLFEYNRTSLLCIKLFFFNLFNQKWDLSFRPYVSHPIYLTIHFGFTHTKNNTTLKVIIV